MKKLFAIGLLLCATTVASAQYKWCVSLNGKQLLKDVREQPEKNIVSISSDALKQPGQFHIRFNRVDTAMRRTIIVRDSTGNGLQNWEEVKRDWRISTKELRAMFENTGSLIFYYTEIPRDINQAMVVKVRPVHLCTVKRSPK